MAGKKRAAKEETEAKGDEEVAASANGRKRRRTSATSRPVLLGGIDIGSTAMRLNISEFVPDAPLRTVEELSHPISTGADTFSHGIILPETIFSICNVLNNFLRLLDDYGVKHRRAVASSAVREAANSEILIDRIRHNSGVKLEMLDAVEESRVAYQALLPWLRQNQGSYSMALNIGGGSTEIMILRGEDLLLGGARRLGMARLFHAIAKGSTGQNKAEILRIMTANIVNTTRDIYQEYTISRFFLINRILYRAFRNDPAAVRHEADFVFESGALRDRLQKAYALSNLELGEHFNMGLSDVEILLPAMLILDNFVSASEVGEVTFTNTEMLSGVLAEMAMTLQGEDPLVAFHRQVVRSARAVGEQYFYDRAHSRVVTEFSLVIFDALRDMLDLGDRDRLILEIAAVLHDVGMYVSERNHHRHSAYLIAWSDIVGLNEEDRVLASQTTYFHRKSMPSTQHPDFMALSQENRIRVRKLAGILRMADVLDRGHSQDIKGLRLEVANDKLYLYLQASGNFGVVLDALPKKANLLEQVTGLQVVLRRELVKS